MYTIFLSGEGRGTGMGYECFVEEFERICDRHVREGRARAFAFIFYNIMHEAIGKAINSERGFEILNDMTGKDMTLFYLHADAIESYSGQFNQKFLEALHLDEQAKPPCIVFFQVRGNNIEEISVQHLDAETPEPYLIVEELRRYVIEYVHEMNRQGDFSGLAGVPIGWFSGLLNEFILKKIGY